MLVARRRRQVSALHLLSASLLPLLRPRFHSGFARSRSTSSEVRAMFHLRFVNVHDEVRTFSYFSCYCFLALFVGLF